METKNKTPKEFSSYEDKPLYKVWDESIVLSLKNVKKLLRAFKQEGIKNETECLIFKDAGSSMYRRVGQQETHQMVGEFEKEEEED